MKKRQTAMGSDTTGAPFVVLMEKDGTEGRHWRNGALVETDSGLSDPWTANFDAAIDLRNAGGTVYAVVVINRALTATVLAGSPGAGLTR